MEAQQGVPSVAGGTPPRCVWRDATNCPMTSCTQIPVEVSLREYLDQARRQVDEALDRFLPEVEACPTSVTPARLAAAMRYSVLGGGNGFGRCSA